MAYVLKRGDFYYFSRRIPQKLRQIIGSARDIRISLGTADRKTAKKIARLLEVDLEKLRTAASMQLPEEMLKSFLGQSVLQPGKDQVAEQDTRFSAIAETFLHEKSVKIRSDGIRIFRETFKEFQHCLGNKHVGQYSHADLIKFRDKISPGISSSTMNKKLRYLSVFFNWMEPMARSNRIPVRV